MREQLLLDTAPLLWWLAGAPLDPGAAERIANPAALVVVSAASVWEIAIKGHLGKLRFPGSAADEARSAGFEHLAITAAHAERAGELALHHRDPFDRMLVAQAELEGLTLVTRDRAFAAYEVTTLSC